MRSWRHLLLVVSLLLGQLVAGLEQAYDDLQAKGARVPTPVRSIR